MDRIKPPALKQGDEIRIVSPSSTADLSSLSRGIAKLRDRGYKISLGETIKNSYTNEEFTVSPEIRARELMDGFKDPKVKAIYCANGGQGAMHILDLLDYDTIRENPKIFIGYSDITGIHLALNRKANLVTFHGPMLSCDLDIIYGPEFQHFLGILEGSTNMLNFRAGERLMRTIGKGRMEGLSMGTNLTVASALFSTEFMPDPENRIFFLEDTGIRYGEIDRILFNISHTNLNKVNGYVFGQFRVMSSSNQSPMFTDNIIKNFVKRTNKFAILEAPFGHGSEQMLIPLNCKVSISSEEPFMEMVEEPVN